MRYGEKHYPPWNLGESQLFVLWNGKNSPFSFSCLAKSLSLLICSLEKGLIFSRKGVENHFWREGLAFFLLQHLFLSQHIAEDQTFLVKGTLEEICNYFAFFALMVRFAGNSLIDSSSLSSRGAAVAECQNRNRKCFKFIAVARLGRECSSQEGSKIEAKLINVSWKM